MRRVAVCVVAVLALAGCTASAKEVNGSTKPISVQDRAPSPVDECVSMVRRHLMVRWDMFVNGPDAEREAELLQWASTGGWDDPAVATYIHFADAGRAKLLQGKTVMGLVAEEEPEVRKMCSTEIARTQ